MFISADLGVAKWGIGARRGISTSAEAQRRATERRNAARARLTSGEKVGIGPGTSFFRTATAGPRTCGVPGLPPCRAGVGTRPIANPDAEPGCTDPTLCNEIRGVYITINNTVYTIVLWDETGHFVKDATGTVMQVWSSTEGTSVAPIASTSPAGTAAHAAARAVPSPPPAGSSEAAAITAGQGPTSAPGSPAATASETIAQQKALADTSETVGDEGAPAEQGVTSGRTMLYVGAAVGVVVLVAVGYWALKD